jgi:hypothetical protein
MPRNAPDTPHPVINAILICDLAIREEGTGKVSLIGIFEEIRAQRLPVQHPRLCLYAKLTDAEGTYKLRLELVRLEDMRAIGQGELEATLADRNKVGEIVFQFLGLVFEAAGRYDFRLSANGRYLGNKTLNVVVA